ncbi:heparinase II/III family protein [Rhabdobacter roseus]
MQFNPYKSTHSFATLFIICLLGTCIGTFGQVAATNRSHRNYLYQEYQRQSQTTPVLDVEGWRKTKKESVKQKLAALSPEVRAKLVSQAQEALGKEWNVLPMTSFLEFTENGNRSNYEGQVWQRRRKLINLVLGELVEQQGTYLPEIANGLWLTLEESTWSFPAFLYIQKEGYGLPDPTEPIIDLTTAETAATVAWAYFLLQEELTKVSPILPKKVLHELDRRIFTPYLERDDFWWMGFSGRRVNNWNVWINSNVLVTTVLALNDETRRRPLIEKNIKSTDFFLNDYPEDGGCDEGPTYWAVAGGALGQYMELLTAVSDQRLDFSKNELIHRIGSYIYKMHVDSNRVVNFADAGPFHVPDPARVYAYGRLFNDEKLKQFAAYCRSITPGLSNGYLNREMTSFFNNLQVESELRALEPKAPLRQESWLPDLQVLALRQQEGSAKGLFLGAKGGHNGESHNHNDVGNFVLYLDGDPVVIDLGPATYRRETFTDERWNIWNFQSIWHNCPLINGVPQKNGRKFAAKETTYTRKNGRMHFSMDLAGTYPEEAQVNRWKREFIFDPKRGSVALEEEYILQEWKQPVDLNFITAQPTQVVKEGVVRLVSQNSTKVLFLHYDPKVFSVQSETKVLDDTLLSKAWGEQVYRLTLRTKQKNLKGKHSLVFKANEQ